VSTAKFVLMLITVSAFCAAAPAQTAGDGPILSLAGYQWYPDAPESAAISALPEGGPRGGQAVAFPVVPRQSCPLLSEALPVEPGRAFTFSAQVKPDIHNGRGDLLVVFLREKDDREDLLAVDSVTFAGKGGWRSVTVNTVSPPEARFVRLRMNVEGSEDARGTVMFADVSFVPSVGVSLLFPDGINVAAPGDAPEVSLHLYGARDGWRFDAAAQVFDVDGNPIEGAQIKWRDITGGEQPWQLPAFGPGHYTIEIEVARAETEGQPIRKRIGFAVLSALDRTKATAGIERDLQ